MRIHQVAMLSICVAFISTSARAQSANAPVMLPGLWEITMQTRSPIVGALLTHTICIDKAQVARPDPPKSRPKDDCQVTPDAAAANETAFTIRCAKRKVTSTSKFTYSGTHYEGTVTINSPDGEVKQVYSALRVGECDLPLYPDTPRP
jgi:hypothetical protein